MSRARSHHSRNRRLSEDASVLVAYTDGSYLPQTRGGFSGSAVFFDSGSPLNLEQHLNGTPWASPRPGSLRAELYACLLAARQAAEIRVRRLVIKTDCKDAIAWFRDAERDHRQQRQQHSDPIAASWLCARQLVHVELSYTPAHTDRPRRQDFGRDADRYEAADRDWVGNSEADRMAKRAAHRFRYDDDVRRMTSENPLWKPWPRSPSSAGDAKGGLLSLCASYSASAACDAACFVPHTINSFHAHDILCKIEQLPEKHKEQVLRLMVQGKALEELWAFPCLRLRLIALQSSKLTLFPATGQPTVHS